MAKITKTFEEIELNSGKVIELTVTVTGTYDPNYGADADGRRGQGVWLKDKWTHKSKCDDDLDSDDEDEILELVEEKVQDDFGDDDFETEDEVDLEYEADDDLF